MLPIDDSLDSSGKKQRHIINEMFQTESDFVDDITFLINQYKKPIEQGEILRPYDINNIFSSIELILACNQALLQKLEASHGEIAALSQAFVDVIPLMNAYITYCSNQSHAGDIIDEQWGKNERFKKFCADVKAMPASRNLSMKDFSIKPLQRICNTRARTSLFCSRAWLANHSQ